MIDPTSAQRPVVVLVPGLWMPAWVMIPLARRLAHCGFGCVRFGYAWVNGTLDENAHRLGEFIVKLGAPQVHIVGHSLGGALAWYATAALGLSHVRRIVLVGSPYAGSHAARRLARCAIGRRLLGRTVPDWLDCAKPPAPRATEVGVIAGTVGIGLGVLVAPDLARPHDGVISLEETRVPEMAAHTCIDVNHASLLVSLRVARLVCKFLLHGRFEDQVPGIVQDAAVSARSSNPGVTP